MPIRWACLWQIDDTEVINFLLSTEIIPLCLKTMEMGSELSKTVATFIVQKILIDQVKLIMHRLPCCLSAGQSQVIFSEEALARAAASEHVL